MPWVQLVCHSFPSSIREITPALRFNAVAQRSLEGRPRAIHRLYNQRMRLPFQRRILFLSPLLAKGLSIGKPVMGHAKSARFRLSYFKDSPKIKDIPRFENTSERS